MNIPLWFLQLIMLGAVVGCARGAVSDTSTTLAAGKKYTLEPTPNYADCTDPGDASQLTDGHYVWGRFWDQKGAVGWSGKWPVVITIDLEKPQTIGGLSFNTAAGTAQVEWPLGIFVLLSGDGKVWHYIGDLMALSARHQGRRLRFAGDCAAGSAAQLPAHGLSTRGRASQPGLDPGDHAHRLDC